MKNKKPLFMKFVLPAILFFGTLTASFAENRALIVGISNYFHTRLNLRGPEVDVKLMKEMARMIGFKENQIKILTDKQATRANILNHFEKWLIAGVGPADKILFYFSGHGAQVTDTDGDENDGCDEVLVPADVVLQGPKAFIVDDEINKYLKRTGAKEILVILDSCHSGTATRGMTVKKGPHQLYAVGKMLKQGNVDCNRPVNLKSLSLLNEKALTNKKYIAFSAAAQNEVALAALVPGDASLFTACLYIELKAAKGPVSFLELRDRTAKRVGIVARLLQMIPHKPQLDGNFRWFNKDFKSFAGKSLGESADLPYEGGIKHAKSNLELFDRVIRDSTFSVRLRAGKSEYKLGEKIHFSVISSKDGYLHIFEISAAGDIVVLFPNKYSSANRVRASTNVIVPHSIGGFNFLAQPPLGKSRIVAVVTRRDFNLFASDIGKIVGDGKFRAISNKDFESLKQTVTTRGIGIVPEERRSEMPQPPHRQFGAGEITIIIKK